jgi:hypothetical protein
VLRGRCTPAGGRDAGIFNNVGKRKEGIKCPIMTKSSEFQEVASVEEYAMRYEGRFVT